MPKKGVIKSIKRIVIGDLTPFNIVYKEGLYYFFYAEKRGSAAHISKLSSSDLINWEYDGDITRENFPYNIGTGSAIFRNGKVYLIYERKALIPETRIIYSRNGINFEKYPLPASNSKPHTIDPRVFYSDGAYYMLAAGKGIYLYRSENLLDWEFKGEILPNKAGIKYISPSIVRLNTKNFIILGEKNKKTKEERTYIAECVIDAQTAHFSLCGEMEDLPLLFPRTSALKDGRVIITGYIKDTQPKITVINELDYDNGILIKPLKELIEKRRDSRELITTIIGNAKYKGLEVNNRELTAETVLTSTDGIEIMIGKSVTVGYKKTTGVFSLVSGEKRLSVYVGGRDKADFQIILANGLCEAYFAGKLLAAPTEEMFSSSIEIKTLGTAVVCLTEYKLDIN